MRFIIYGAGAVGGVIGGRLFEHGHDVVLIARGAHLAAIRENGLTVLSPAGSVTVSVPAVGAPREVDFRGGDVVILAMKTQDTEPALAELLAAAGDQVPVVCAQNGVENERRAARRFANVYGMPVRLPATHLEPGLVQADSSPWSGVLDIGHYPDGIDDVAIGVSAALAVSTFSSVPEPRVMRHKYQKLLMNLGNGIDAALGSPGGGRDLGRRAREEALACYTAAGIDCASDEEDRVRRGSFIQIGEIGGQRRKGGSTWQSLARGRPDVEVDYLNGEIVLLGRQHGVPAPVNAGLQRVANRLARQGAAAGSMTEAELVREVLGGP